MHTQKAFVPIPKYPPVIEDLALFVPTKVRIGDIIATIKKQSHLIADATLLEEYQQTKTFHIVYQHQEKNLTSEEVTQIRNKMLSVLEEKFGIEPKE